MTNQKKVAVCERVYELVPRLCSLGPDFNFLVCPGCSKDTDERSVFPVWDGEDLSATCRFCKQSFPRIKFKIKQKEYKKAVTLDAILEAVGSLAIPVSCYGVAGDRFCISHTEGCSDFEISFAYWDLKVPFLEQDEGVVSFFYKIFFEI